MNDDGDRREVSNGEVSSVSSVDEQSSNKKKVIFLNNSSEVLNYKVNYEVPEIKQYLVHALHQICPEWKNLPQDLTEIEKVSGGITNLLYRITGLPDHPGVLIRIYGRNTEVIIDRERDCAVFAELSKLNFAPTFWGRFLNGRIEGNLAGARPLEPHEMGQKSDPDFTAMIARELARMHNLDVPAAKESSLEAPKPILFDTLSSWLQIAKEISFEDGKKQELLESLDIEKMSQQLLWLKSQIETLSKSTAKLFMKEVVFSHQDILSGNILWHPSWDRVQLIDYEYGGYNYRGFDIGNHFCEYAGFDFNIKDNFPRQDQQLYFLRQYLESVSTNTYGSMVDASQLDEFLEALHHEVAYYVLASHLWWGFWAIVQAKYSPIDFDYLGYSKLRFDGYFFHQQTLVSDGDTLQQNSDQLYQNGVDQSNCCIL